MNFIMLPESSIQAKMNTKEKECKQNKLEKESESDMQYFLFIWVGGISSGLEVSAPYKQLQLTFPNAANKVSNQAKFKLPFDTKQHIVLETVQ